MLLEKIKNPTDLKKLDQKQIPQLVDEIRQKLLDTVSKNGGHLASNLCVVELTVALHRVFSSPDDKIIFDVGHQCYVHKMLTGRYDRFDSLRQEGGISGFTSPSESDHDAFGTGHSSTSISAAVGIAAANKIKGNDFFSIAVVGDGAFTGGMIYEALNNCSDKDNLIIILNDNDMSISANVGGMSRYFSKVRTSAKYFRFKNGTKRFFEKIPFVGNVLIKGSRSLKNGFRRMVMSQNFFEHLGLGYYGPLDGNDERHIEEVLREAKDDGKCSVVHICTKKGKGYAPAELHPEEFHGVSGFDIETGKIKNGAAESYSHRFGSILCDRAEKDSRICAITASMESGTGLTEFAKRFPDRFFDVGIAEQHATTFACGMARQGLVPVFAVYSTFMQRAYDQLLHDAAIQNFHVVFALDRAGLVANDGVTHHGIFDVSFATSIPNVSVFAPHGFCELEECMDRALNAEGPVAVRYPKGSDTVSVSPSGRKGDCAVYDPASDPKAVIVTYGSLTENALKAADILKNNDTPVRVIRLIRIDDDEIANAMTLIGNADVVLFAEEGIKNGGAGQRMGSFFAQSTAFSHKKYAVSAIDGVFPKHGSNNYLQKELGLDPHSLAERVLELFREG